MYPQLQYSYGDMEVKTGEQGKRISRKLTKGAQRQKQERICL